MEPKSILLLIILALAIVGAGYYAGKTRSDTQWQLKWSQRDTADKTAQSAQETKNREIEQERQQFIAEISNDAEKKLQAIQADAAAAGDAADRLHGAVAQLQQRLRDSQSTVDSAIAGKRSAEARAAILFAELLEQSDKTAGEYARETDDARARGLACERAYDAIAK